MLTYETIKKLCKIKGVTVTGVEKELGFARGSLCKVNTNKPSMEKVQKLADYFGESIDALLTGKDIDVLIESDMAANGKNGLIAILNDLYGDAKMCEVTGERSFTFYFPLDRNFALHEQDFDKLYDMVKPIIKDLADLMKEDRTLVYKSCLDTVKTTYSLNAAHARTDIDVTEEMIKHDDDIMDDDDF